MKSENKKILQEVFMTESGLNKYRLRDKFLGDNPQYVVMINEIIPRDDLSITTKIQMIIYNDGDICRNCKINKLDGIGKRQPYTCKECVKKIAKQKRENTIIEKWNGIEPVKHQNVKNKIIETKKNKYGLNYYEKSLEKRKQTMKEKYGVEYASQKENFKEMVSSKISNSITKKIICNYNQKYYSNDADIDYIFEEMKKLFGEEISYNKISQELNMPYSTTTQKFKNFGIKKSASVSEGEENLNNEIEQFLPHTLRNERLLEGKEIDIYIPSKKIGVEYNGVYNHSDARNKPVSYHKDKFIIARKKNITLLQFWDYEFQNKKDIVISMIKSKIGINNKIYARKCVIKEIDSKTYRSFCEMNHLQGSSVAKIKIGLYHNNELVSVMSFGHSRFNKSYQYEMVRYCNKLNTNVIGGASKLWNYFLKTYNPKSVITFADARISNGDLYNKLGFTFLRHSKPNHFYIKNKKIYNRLKMQKHKLKEFLENYNENISSSENIKNNNYNIVYDAGNLVFGYLKA